MVGDNPAVDINGARQVRGNITIGSFSVGCDSKKAHPVIICFTFQAGQPWFSILTRTGVFKGKQNHTEYPADLVCENPCSPVFASLFPFLDNLI